MAGIFGLFDNYDKPGPGVPENYVQKFGIKEFFKLYFRKFWHLIPVGIVYVVISIPALLFSGFLVSYFIVPIMRDNYSADLTIRFLIASVLLSSQLIVMGPIHAGYTYVINCYVSEKPVFDYYDWWAQTKANFKQGLIVMLIDFAVTCIMCYTYLFYSSRGGVFFSILSGIAIVFLCFYMMMHIYIYPLMTTFKYSVWQLYTTSVRFAAAQIHLNLPVLLITIGLLYVLWMNMLVGIVLVPLAGIVTISFFQNYVAYYGIKKFLLCRITNEE